MTNIGIIGAGSWGCALSLVLGDNGHNVTIWSRNPGEVDNINNIHEQVDKLPNIKLPDNVKGCDKIEEVVSNNSVLIMAIPSKFVREISKQISKYVKDGTIIVDVSKGIEESTFKTLSEQISEEIPNAKVSILSGPSHAEEVGRRIPTVVVASALELEVATKIQKLFMNEYFRVYTSPDIKGIELGGSLKNVIALAAGICDGLGTGDNTKAALITRGVKEMASIGVKEGGHIESFYGLAGMGDLIVTCESVHSRNRKAGYLIGQGKPMQEAMDEVKMIVEGVYSAKAAVGLADKYNLEVPIIRSVYEILFNNKKADKALHELMIRNSKTESPLLPWS